MLPASEFGIEENSGAGGMSSMVDIVRIKKELKEV